jgi:hypothetical protein
MVETNLQFQKVTKKSALPGDVFSLKLPDSTFIFGRVIVAESMSDDAPVPGGMMLYIYDVHGSTPDPDVAALRPDRLLIPPKYTNRMLWTKGYAVTVAHTELTPEVLLPQHCFWHPLRNKYVDENGVVIAERHEPCGSWGVGSYRMLDDLISDALGIARVPIDPED